MVRDLGRLDTQRAFKLFADWTDRIAAGELPKSQARSGRRASSATSSSRMWDWGTPKTYLHDEIATDRRNPTVNANGPIYGSPELSTDFVPVLDPVNNRAYDIKMPVRDPKTPSSIRRSDVRSRRPIGATSRSGTARPRRTTRCSTRRAASGSPSRIRAAADRRPSAGKGSDHPSAKLFPLEPAGRQLAMYDPQDGEVHADRHLLQHPSPAVRRARTGCGHRAASAARRRRRRRLARSSRCSTQPATSRTRRAGRRSSSTPTATASATSYVEPNQPVDPTKDKRILAGFYGIAPSPARRHRSGARCSASPARSCGSIPATIRRRRRCRKSIEVRRLPGYSPRGMDIDRNGVVWTPLASGHLASFDRRKCKGPLNGPDRDRQALPRRLDAVSVSRPAVRGRVGRPAAPKRATTPGSTSTTRSASARTCRSPPAINRIRCIALVDGQVRRAARALSDGLLRQGPGRTHRRCRTPAGRAAASGPLTATARRSTSKAARARGRKVVKFQLRPDPLAR